MEPSTGPRGLSVTELALWLDHLNEVDSDSPPLAADEGRIILDSDVHDGMAVRSLSQATASRQLAFATSVGEVALNIVSFPRLGQVEVHGQFLDPRGGEAGTVQARLIGDGDTSRSAEADDLGEFSFAGVAPGQYRLLLKVSQTSILIPLLDLAA